MQLHLLRDLLRTNGSGSTGQQVPGSDQDVGKSNPSKSSAAPQSPTQPTMATTTLSSLLDAQQAPPTARDIAAKLIAAVDGDSDGALSLDEIQNALPGKAKGQASKMSDAFTKLDADNDGKLSAAELTSGLEAMFKAQHHHGHSAYAKANETTTTTPPVTTTPTSADVGSTSGTTEIPATTATV